jgi:hypothetical protein
MTRKLGMFVLIGAMLVTAQALGNSAAKTRCSPERCASGQTCAAAQECDPAACPVGPCGPSCPMPRASDGATGVAVLSIE